MTVTLLLADDSVVIQKLVGLSFANEDIEIITVDNGDDAVSRAIECKPDVILADVVMPGLSGYEVCSAIRNNPELAGTPVLLLTGTFEAFDEGRANDVGATGHITKPFEAQVLVDRVTEILAQCSEQAPASVTPVAEGDFFDENLGKLAGSSSAAGVSAAPSADDSFAFGTSLDSEPLSSASPSSSFPSPLSSPTDDIGGETVAMVSDSELDDLLDGAGGDRTVAIMPESFGEDLMANAPSIDSREDSLAGLSNDPGQTILVDDFLDTSSPNTEPIAETRFESSRNESSGTAIGSLNLETEPARSPMASLDLPTAPVESVSLDSTPLDAAPLEPAIDSSLDLDGSSFARQPNLPVIDFDTPSGDETVLSDDLFSGGPDLESSLDGSLTDPITSRMTESQGLDIDFAGDAHAESIVPDNANDYDVSASDLNVDLLGNDSSWSAGIPAGVQTAPAPIARASDALDNSASAAGAQQAQSSLDLNPTNDGVNTPPPVPTSGPGVSASGHVNSSPEITKEMGNRIHDTLEKVAWEAFSDLSDDIVAQLMKRVEQIAWEVIPQMAETLIRDEIRRMKAEEGVEGVDGEPGKD
jgi:CheY-like chemotaxis protein